MRFPMSLAVVYCLMLAMSVQAQTVRSLNLVANHILYEPVSGKIYATVPSSVGTKGNSIATIDPARATILRYVFMGSEPNPLAASNDGQFLYAGLDGADAIRRYTVATDTAGLQFSLGSDPTFGPYHALDLKVLPGAPHAVAVSRANSLGISVAIYDDGVQRPKIASGSMNTLAFSNSAAALYAYDAEDTGATLFKLTVGAQGVSVNSSIDNLLGAFGGPIVFDAKTKQIIDTSGQSVDPQTLALSGTFTSARLAYNYFSIVSGVIGGVLPDTASRVFFLIYDGEHQSSTVTVAAFDPATFLPIGSLVIPNVLTPGNFQDVAADLIRWGSDGLAFRTTSGQIWLISGRSFPGLADFQLSAAKVVGGATVTGTLTLSQPAPPGGAVVTLSSDSSLASPPASVTVAAGHTSVSFSISTSSGTQDVTLTAAYGVQSIAHSLEVDASSSTSLYPADVRVIELQTNHLVFDPSSKLLYASVPSSVVGVGNSIATIDPATGTILRHVFIGSEPGPLAASDDGQFLYAGLGGADAIGRYTIATHSGLQFWLGSDPNFGPYQALDLKVLPGAPHAVAVSRANSLGISISVAIYDDGVQRPKIASGSMNTLAFSNSAAALYAQDTADSGATFYSLAVDASGVSLSSAVNGLCSGPIVFDPNTSRIIDRVGKSADPVASALSGTFTAARLAYNYAGTGSGVIGGVLPDTASRVFFLIYDGSNQSSTVTVAAFDPSTFMPIGSLLIPNVRSTQADLVPWGTDGLAFRTTNGKIFLISGRWFPGLADFKLNAAKVLGGAMVTGTVTLSQPAPPGGAVVTLSSDSSLANPPTSVTVAVGQTSASFSVPTSSGTQDVTLTAAYGVQYIDRPLEVDVSSAASVYPPNVRVIHLETNDLIFDPFSKLIYASVPSSQVGIGNSITAIDPVKGSLGASVFLGSEPYRLAISGDGSFIYAGLYGAASIRRFDPPTQTAELQYSLGNDSFFGPRFPGELVVLPGEPHALAVSRFYSGVSPSFAGVPIYDNAVERPNVYTGFTGGESIAAGATAGRLYGYDNESSGFEFDRFNVDSSGITLLDSTSNVISGYFVEITYQGGFVFSNHGDVVNAEAHTLAGTFSGIDYNSAVLPDLPDNKVYFIDTDNSGNTTLRLYNPKTFLEIAAFPLPGVQGNASSLLKWNTDNVAFRTSTGQVFLVNAALPTLSSLTITPSTVVGGKRPTGRVTLSNVAPVGGVKVSLVSSNSSVVSVPSTVTVRAGAQRVSFNVTTSNVSSQTAVTVTAKYKSAKSVTMTITP